MNITSINGIEGANIFSNSAVKPATGQNRNEAFETLFQSALGLVKNTNELSNQKDVEQMKYALGITENPHDLQVAESKASSALQYTVAVRNKFIEAYKEIMNMQF